MAVSIALGHGHGARENDEDPVVQELRSLDDEYLALERQCRAECVALNETFRRRYSEILSRRSEHLASCGHEPIDASTSGGATSSRPPDRTKATPPIPGFWKLVLQNSPDFCEDIEEYDEPVLDYLQDIASETLPVDSNGEENFMLRFIFLPNPFFSNSELTKVYHVQQKSAFIDRIRCVRIEASTINWNIGKNVTVEIVTRKPKGGGRKKMTKSKREEVARPSFFRAFFRNLGPDEDVPEEELADLADEDGAAEADDVAELMECLINEDYMQGVSLRESIIRHAVRWYTGEACDDGDGGEEDGDDEEEEEEEEEEEDDDKLDKSLAQSSDADSESRSGAEVANSSRRNSSQTESKAKNLTDCKTQ